MHHDDKEHSTLKHCAALEGLKFKDIENTVSLKTVRSCLNQDEFMTYLNKIIISDYILANSYVFSHYQCFAIQFEGWLKTQGINTS